MGANAATELLLIRHAPAANGGCLAGRRDVPADLPEEAVIAATRAALGEEVQLVASPALRCQQTAAALFPNTTPSFDERLWEQDFGAWEGVPFKDLPDIGQMTREALAHHRPPGGESFADQCARVHPALTDLAGQGGRIAVVAHAGVVRAALSLAMGHLASGLAFDISPFSVTKLLALPNGHWVISNVNRTFG
ncbi:alpha-ribazole phosphatase [Rhodobacter aestuarii]|uniref:Alpha-ribazole phosphatase n=1 Tax=Rhodobacter aestuarii TaxID=453582 RepID=A0A1N7J3N0_9RHOB|nr:histidine phosphatase family protein [Rhodobacter aestuarii]PTV97231.1 alpha-ribazole phosphatase [Rhodobacter aestuarii]SIS43847.1 alpha-ribazole phosphatase [Rhodobacter aestuarii]